MTRRSNVAELRHLEVETVITTTVSMRTVTNILHSTSTNMQQEVMHLWIIAWQKEKEDRHGHMTVGDESTF